LLMKFFSYLFVIVGLAFLAYGGFHLLESHFTQDKRLSEAKDFVYEDVVEKAKSPEELVESEVYDFDQGETAGTLYIPKLDREIAIVVGTDEEELAQGVGHYVDTGYPGENKQILLSGHRDTVFRKFGELENGDEFHIKIEHGKFIYEISDHEIVSADNITVIDESREDEYLTVSTCYPFSYVWRAPDSYVLYDYCKYNRVIIIFGNIRYSH